MPFSELNFLYPFVLKHIYAPVFADSMRISCVLNPAIVVSIQIYAVGINILVNNKVHFCPKEFNNHKYPAAWLYLLLLSESGSFL